MPGELMRGRVVLVTGTTSGIGLETARQLAGMGAQLVLGVRDPVRGADVARRIVEEGGKAEVLPVDLASFTSVRQAAAGFAAKHEQLDVLVNNAGIALPRREVSVDGHELTWQTNFLSHVLLTRLLLPSLSRGARPRVVSVSSEGHRTGRIDWDEPGARAQVRRVPGLCELQARADPLHARARAAGAGHRGQCGPPGRDLDEHLAHAVAAGAFGPRGAGRSLRETASVSCDGGGAGGAARVGPGPGRRDGALLPPIPPGGAFGGWLERCRCGAALGGRRSGDRADRLSSEPGCPG